MSAPLQADVPIDAPEHCPGVESKSAGKSSACDGCPNQSFCASDAPKLPDPDLGAIRDRMASVKKKILVLSGKGGVGKSTFSSGLGWALSADEEKQVGLMDIDICGPSLPHLLGLQNETLHTSSSGWSPIYVTPNLACISIGFLLPSTSAAIIWRGPKKNQLIKQFLKDVDWTGGDDSPSGQLDYLVVDTPPGTSDEHLSVVQYLKEGGIDGAVLVTTPQEVSLQDVRKELDFCRKVGVKVLGVVENMSGFVCPSCNGKSDVFFPSTGGAEALAEEAGITFLGSIPLDPRIGKSCDMGVSFLEEYPDSPATQKYMEIVEKIKASLE